MSGLGYFSIVGLAYLVVEMGWMQRTGLFLGHPTHAVVVTLVTLLLASGFGGAWSAKRDPTKAARAAAVAIVALLGLAELVLPRMFAALLPLPLSVRVLALMIVTAPLGFAMGIPFPSGLRVAAEDAQGL